MEARFAHQHANPEDAQKMQSKNDNDDPGDLPQNIEVLRHQSTKHRRTGAQHHEDGYKSKNERQ